MGEYTELNDVAVDIMGIKKMCVHWKNVWTIKTILTEKCKIW